MTVYQSNRLLHCKLIFSCPLSQNNPAVPQERPVENWADKSMLHGASQTGLGSDYPHTAKRESLFLDRESHLESHIPSSGISLYGQDPGLVGMRSTGLGRAGGPIVTQVSLNSYLIRNIASHTFDISGTNVCIAGQ